MHVRGSGEAARRVKRGRQSEKKKERLSFFRASPVSRVAICVSRILLDGLQKKERLLVVYSLTGYYLFGEKGWCGDDRLFTVLLFFCKIIEMQRFALRPAILHECQNY